MNKKWAIALYVAYSIALVLVLSFGTSVSSFIIDSVRATVNRCEIEDIIIDIDADEALLTDGIYGFTYTAIGDFDDPGIRFESLNTDVLTVSYGEGLVYTYPQFDGAETEVDIRLTSRNDADFEKTVTVKVKKRYPESFAVQYLVSGCGYNLGSLQVGMTVYPYSYTTEKNCVNEYDIICNEEYFAYDKEKAAYVAIKETEAGEELCFTVRYPDGRTLDSRAFSILPAGSAEDFDEIKIGDVASDSITLINGDSITPILYKNGTPLQASVDVSYTNPDSVIIGKGGYYLFTGAGDHTFTFTLPNGFSKTLNVSVRNELRLPVITDTEIIDGDRITVLDDQMTILYYTYPEEATYCTIGYECEGEAVNVTEGYRCLYITPNEKGEATLKIAVDDGYERLEKTYSIEVVKNRSFKSIVNKFIEAFVTKILGHTLIFAFLAVFAINMFRFIIIENKYIKLALYFSSALPTAVITEVIQIFQPARYARFTDVLIDLCGFSVGTAITVLVLVAKRKKRSEPREREEIITEEAFDGQKGA